MEIDLETELENLKAKLEDLKKCTESKSNEIMIGKQILEIGLLYNKLGNNNEALKCYNEFLEIKNQPNEISIERALIKIGTLYRNQSNFEEVLKCYKGLLENYKQTLEPNNPIIADTLNAIGVLYQIRGKYEKALKYYEQSLEIKNRSLPLNQSLIASQVNNKYSKSEKENNVEIDLENELENIKDLKKCTESNNNEIIIGKKILEILEIGLLYDDQGNYEKALTYLNASFEMFKQAMPMENVVNKIRLAFENSAKCYYQSKKKAIQTTDEAENLLKEKLFEVIGKKKNSLLLLYLILSI